MSEETTATPGAQSPPVPAEDASAADGHTEDGAPQDERTEEPWAARLGLVRPRHGRYLAGVCAAIGRATNTDPLLWRVLIGVLAVFGVGIVIYLAGWLVTPAEGDTASPIEALFGRGRSGTSAVLTLILAVITVVLLGALTNSSVVAVIAAVALVVAALAVNPRIKPQQRKPAKPEEPVTTMPAAQPAEQVGQVHPAYQPPFAPHGPYAGAAEPVPPKIKAKPKPEPSQLGRVIFGLILLSLGALGLADMAGAPVPMGVYFAAALAVVGIGLIIGAWFGRARGFILLGLLMSMILPVIPLGEDVARGGTGREYWTPTSVTELSNEYSHRFGEATLDLTEIDFTDPKAGGKTEISADVAFGGLRILLPPDVDATVVSNVSFGDAMVFGKSTNGVGIVHTEKNQGTEGGGTIVIELHVRFGYAEVTR